MSKQESNGSPEKIKLWVLMFGLCALIVLLYASYSMFFGRARQGQGGTNDGKRPVQPAREMWHMPLVTDRTGDLATHSNARDTDLPIEVKATPGGTLQRPQ